MTLKICKKCKFYTFDLMEIIDHAKIKHNDKTDQTWQIIFTNTTINF